MFSTENLRFTFSENGITAVDGVSLQFEAGKIHAVLGENGAGKSTLARLCTGHLQPDSGRMIWNGSELRLQSPADSIRQGLVLVPQHPQLSAELTVWENLLIGLHPVPTVPSGILSPTRAPAALAAALNRYGITLPLTQKAGTLDTAQLHWAAIGEALLKNPSVLFLDEPSASFSPQEITQLYGILRSCADRGACILVVTHRIQEVLTFMDTVHILRNGKTIHSGALDPSVDAERLLQDIFGAQAFGTAQSGEAQNHSSRPEDAQNTHTPTVQSHYLSVRNADAAQSVQSTPQAQPNKNAPQEVHAAMQQNARSGQPYHLGLEIAHIFAVNRKGASFSDFSLQAPCGSITGIVGIKKQGLELLEYLLVNTVKPSRGTIIFNGKPLSSIRREKYAYIPSKRMRNGIADRHSIAENLYVRARALLYHCGIYSKKAVSAWKNECPFDIPRLWEDSILSLSGGMIQKLIFSRELDNPQPQLVICAEPYWGLDRKVQLNLLHRLRSLAANGAAVIVLTSDADAAMETCDRIHVLYRGAITRFMEQPPYNRSVLIAAMMQADTNA